MNASPRVIRPGSTWTGVIALLLAPFASGSALAFDYQIHGYAAQGLLYSSGNNYFGHSTQGSVDYDEAGLNASAAPLPNLVLAAQVAIRRAGADDNDRPRLDFALADYRFLASQSFSAGIRGGKVKNSLGFYNETRDVVFTRPSIILPTIYGDNQDQRDLVFAAPGAQLYGDALWHDNDLSLTLTASRGRGVNATDRNLLLQLQYGPQAVPFSLLIDHSWNFQFMDSIDNGRWEFAYSRFYGRFALTATLPTAPPLPVFGRFDVGIDYFSARFNGERFTVTAEYAQDSNKEFVALAGQRVAADDQRAVGDGGYLQAEYRLTNSWGLMARADAFFDDRLDRDGKAYAAANPGISRYARFTYDGMLGAHWTHGEHWGIWGEYHWLYGDGIVQRLDNAGRTPRPHWSLLALMGAYKF